MSAGRRWGRAAAAWGVAALALGAGVWWTLTVPYRPMAVYEAMPDGVTAASRHVEVAGRWDDFSSNPLVLALARAAGASERDVKDVAADDESRAWLAKLTGREAVLGYRPAAGLRADAWLGAAWIGGGAQRLRWQLQLFRVPGYTRLHDWPGHAAWLVDGVEFDDGRVLAIAFEEGLILAALSRDAQALGDLLKAKEGYRRLADASPGFREFAQGDDRKTPDRAWVVDAPTGGTAAELEIDEVSVAVLRGTARGAWGGTGRAAWPEENEAAWEGSERFTAVLGDAPCAVLGASRAALSWAATNPETPSAWAHALRMVLAAGGDRVAAALLDGDFGGHLAFGMMRAVGLGGLKVPTLLLASPADGGETAVRRKLQAVLDSCNARYRAAFVMAPSGTAGGVKCWTLESAGGNEWVDMLALSDRPAFAVIDGWLYVSSNLAALKLLAERAASGGAPAGTPPPRWAAAARRGAPVWLWADMARGGKTALELLGTFSIAARWLPPMENAPDWQALLASWRGWAHAAVPFGEGRAEAVRTPGRGGAWVDLRFDLGLPGDAGAE